MQHNSSPAGILPAKYKSSRGAFCSAFSLCWDLWAGGHLAAGPRTYPAPPTLQIRQRLPV